MEQTSDYFFVCKPTLNQKIEDWLSVIIIDLQDKKNYEKME
jgi:hypothetical protein